MLREDAEADGCETVVARDESGRVVGFAQLVLRHPRAGHPWIGLLLVDGRLLRHRLVQRSRRSSSYSRPHAGDQQLPRSHDFWTAVYQSIDD